MTSRRPTLVFGGTFDPPHRVHADIARRAADILGAEEIWVIPAAVNPQRTGAPPAPPDDRLAMTRIAFRHEPRARILDVEIRRGGPSYTIDTLRELRAKDDRPMRLLIGSDQALNFPTWRSWRDVAELAPPAIVLRPPHDAATFARDATAAFGPEAPAWIERVLPIPPVDMSATDVRLGVARGASTSRELDDEVAGYVREHRLYESRG
ncbi:MAG: nicotinate (nicotinamide) nucleotide adenylyltransferase [Phycisphaerales bacterium]